MSKLILKSAVLAVGLVTNAFAGYFEAIKDPSCVNSSFMASNMFSTGEQYMDSNNGILMDRWSMLARWQGMNESNFMSNSVVYNVGIWTGLNNAPYQRGVAPEDSSGTAAVQLDCYYSGMLINTWSVPHRPIVGGAYNDMFGYAFSEQNQVSPFVNQYGAPSDLVLQSNISVPLFSPSHNTLDANGQTYPIAGEVGFYAYLRDTANPSYPPIVILAMTHMSTYTAGFAANNKVPGFDYSAADTNAAKSGPFSNWFQNTPWNGQGIWFVSAPINSAHTRWVTTVTTEAQLTSAMQPRYDLSQPMPFWRAHITPTNLTNAVMDINNVVCSSCPPKPPGGYSTTPANWVLEYAGVIAEARLVSDEARNSYDPSRTNWGGHPYGPTPYNDTTKDQVSLGVRLWAPGIYRYVH